MITTQERKEEPPTFEKVWELFQEIGRKQEETARQMQETAKEADRRMAEADRRMAETDRKLESIGVKLGGISHNNGEFAEEYFAMAMKERKVFAGWQFDEFRRNVTGGMGKLQDEFDIVLSSDTAVALIKVKYRVHDSYLDTMLTQKVPNFRAMFPDYAGRDIYLGIGSMSFYDDVITKAHDLGIGILRLNGDTIEEESGPIRAY
ncbi:hypothetical protein ACYULU_05590 [Breznakiellaceae bacterium SP9]